MEGICDFRIARSLVVQHQVCWQRAGRWEVSGRSDEWM